MDMKALLKGRMFDDERFFVWDLIFTPVTKSGTFAPGNQWTVRINRVTGEIVFDRRGLHVRANLATMAADVPHMGICEKTVVSMFCDLLRIYSEKEFATVSMDFEVNEEAVSQYLLNPVFTVNVEPLTVAS